MAKARKSAASKATPTTEGLADQAILDEARKRFTRCEDWESTARARAKDDLKFYFGDAENGYQWPIDIRQQRDIQRSPTLTINMTRQFALNIINDSRQHRASIKVDPVGDAATYDGAQIISGLIKRIEADSHATDVYDHGISRQVQMGWGYWRVLTRYVSDDSLDQEVIIAPVDDPFAVFVDPDAKAKDKSDMRFGFIFEDVPRDQFDSEYPDVTLVGSSNAVGTIAGWMDKNHVRVAEYYRLAPRTFTLVMIPDEQTGDLKPYNSEDVPAPIWKALLADHPDAATREVETHDVEWFKIAGNQIIDRRTRANGNRWPGTSIPIVKLVGEESVIDGQYDCRGHVRFLKDPNRMYNYWTSAAVEQVALQSKIPWVGSARAIEGYEVMWSNANVDNYAILVFNDVDDKGQPIPPPQRIQPPVMANAYIQGMQIAQGEMRMAAGQHQEDLGVPSNATSGVAVNARIRQSSLATQHFVENLASALEYTGRIIVELIPKVYDTKRVMRIMGDDNTKIEVVLDPQAAQEYAKQQEQQQDKARIIFNPGFGKYSVIVEAGPSLATRRQEAFTALAQLLQGNPQMLPVAGDLLFKSADFPLAGELAERLRRMVPPALLGQGPTQQEQQLMDQVQQLRGALQELLQKQARNDVEREDGALKHMVAEFRAETERLGLLVKSGAMTPEMIQALVVQAIQQTLATRLPVIPPSMIAPVQLPAPQPSPAPMGGAPAIGPDNGAPPQGPTDQGPGVPT